MDLCVRDDVKAWLGIAADAVSEDALLDRLISAVSTDFQSVTNNFDFASAQLVEIVVGDGTAILVPRHSPITAVTKITDDDGVILTASADGLAGGWRLVPDPDPERQCTIEIVPSQLPTTAAMPNVFTQGKRFKLEYTAGYNGVPDDVEQAVIDWVALRYRGRQFIGQTSKHLQTGETVSFQGMLMPDTTRAVAERYRRDPVRM